MIALLLTFGTFVVFCLVGLGVLAAVRADTGSLRLVLTAPALGTATIVLPLFVLSHAGVPIGSCALAVTLVLVAGAIGVVAWRRPQLPLAAAPVLAICALGLLLVGWPMLTFEFRWIANANDDMANYVLSAIRLLDNGLLGGLDVEGLSRGRNYASATQGLHDAGGRPGADIVLAALADVTGRNPYEVFMPLIIAFHLTAVCGVAALTMQAAQRWWAASLAALLFVISPMATFGVVQQLLPQTWGVGLAAALFALLMRRELHQGKGAAIGQLLIIGLLATALVVGYVELASTAVVVYGLYVVLLAVRREIDLRAILRLWAVPLAITALFVNTYLIREVQYVRTQASSGLSTSLIDSIFGFVLIPSALPGMLGFLKLPPPPTTHLDVFIVVSLAVVAVLLVVSAATALRGYAASVALLTYMVIGFVLWSRSNDFGLYKLSMYVQPFLASAIAVWLAGIARRRLLALAPLLLPLVLLQLGTQHKYVSLSRDPVDLPNASSEQVLPAFRHFVEQTSNPIITVTENPTLAKLEAASMGTRPLYFISKDLFEGLTAAYSRKLTASHRRSVERLTRLDSWSSQSFDLGPPNDVNTFEDNRLASRLLARGDCVVVLPTGSQGVLNRRVFPEGSPDIVMRPCERVRNLLVFTTSELGQGFYLPARRQAVSFYQLERDSFYPGRTMAGLGRYVLFRILRPSERARLTIEFTKSLRHDGSNRLPRVSVVGSSRTSFDLVGRGSARVISKPIRPQIIGDHSFVLVDMGEEGRIQRPDRNGIQGLYNRSIPADIRYLTSYVRDISLVDAGTYQALRAPSALRQFPADLADQDVEYSGMYEDGWVAEDSYVFLAGGGPTRLVVRAQVQEGTSPQRLRISVDGRRVFAESVRPGRVEVSVPLPAARGRRKVALHFARSTPLPGADLRPVAARLEFIGLDSEAAG